MYEFVLSSQCVKQCIVFSLLNAILSFESVMQLYQYRKESIDLERHIVGNYRWLFIT